jgi:3-oxoacyl-[acyl-carrier-protein] synthase-3
MSDDMTSYGAIIAGTGSHVPEKRLTNADLSAMVDTSDEWIVQRTGIKERRIAGSHETTATLASHAATKALQAAALEPKHLDIIIVATASPEMVVPSTACFVAASLGLDSTPAFDVNAACSGFVYALDIAGSYVKSGAYKNVLVIGAETLSRITDYKDRASCILFGDGAGAVVVQRSLDTRRGILYTSLKADGRGWELLYCAPGSRRPIDEALVAGRQHFLTIRGRDIYKFAVQRFNELIEDAMARCDLSVDKIKLIVPHQVNLRIIDSALEKLKIPREKAYVNIDRYGNTSSASIPIALDEAMRSGKLKQGDVVLMVAFGAGLTWANAVVRV